MDNKKNLEVLLFLYKTVVFGKVLYFDSKFIMNITSVSQAYFNAFNGGPVIMSNAFPQLEISKMYAWGRNAYKNNDTIYIPFRSEENALDYYKSLQNSIEIFNGMTIEQIRELQRARVR
mgnify:CR=1 FL=1